MHPPRVELGGVQAAILPTLPNEWGCRASVPRPRDFRSGAVARESPRRRRLERGSLRRLLAGSSTGQPDLWMLGPQNGRAPRGAFAIRSRVARPRRHSMRARRRGRISRQTHAPASPAAGSDPKRRGVVGTDSATRRFRLLNKGVVFADSCDGLSAGGDAAAPTHLLPHRHADLPRASATSVIFALPDDCRLGAQWCAPPPRCPALVGLPAQSCVTLCLSWTAPYRSLVHFCRALAISLCLPAAPQHSLGLECEEGTFLPHC